MSIGVPTHSTPHPDGVVIVVGNRGEVQRDTLQCCHCGQHFIVQRYSGRRRGFCSKCKRVTCGAPGCDPCMPTEKRLDLYERGQINLLV